MRLWHKELIPVLPKEQLVGQWRECCSIASKLADYGTPRHILVNKINDYPIDHFYNYTILLVYKEMRNRGYAIKEKTLNKFNENMLRASGRSNFGVVSFDELFRGWHSTRYLAQCLLNLEEKHDCGGISYEDWFKILSTVKNHDEFCNETFQSLFV